MYHESNIVFSFYFILFQFFVFERYFIQFDWIFVLHHLLKQISGNTSYTVIKMAQLDKDFLYILSYLFAFKFLSSCTVYAPLKALFRPAGTTLQRLDKHLQIRRRFACSLQNGCSEKIEKVQGKRLCQSPATGPFS